MKGGGLVAAIAGAILLVPLMVVVLIAGGGNCAAGATTGSDVDSSSISGSIAGYSGKQLDNAAAIMNAATALELDSKAQVIGVMTAMGESSLQVLDKGDAVGPDSRGLFQQRGNGAWGSYEDRMNPTISATNFFKALIKVQGWQDLTPTIAAHRVQGNADPNHYAKFYDPAVKVVSELSGKDLSTIGGDTSSSTCNVGPTGNYEANGTAPGKWGGYDNGKIPESELAPVPWTAGQAYGGTMYLRPDAVQSLIAMNNAFKEDIGHDLPLNDAYRDYAGQVAAKEQYGGEAATPGKSNHGWALAIDIGTTGHARIAYNDTTYNWLKANAGKYGWVHPAWAEPGGVGPHEAWHWEYYGVSK
ncbi:D-alanyl-D-alanine carboxypeptidase-like protein [Curtobacterium sp. AG1037]|uniref:M15 family metallopeptidase n=1 Tax=Curtobacterium sp. AG1037 TaxID=2183990 RepID=UPI000E0A6D0A|nr:M15 family metallopeptidase [Curtobacterium sp. AG1037]RDH95052.1 D-alanyl-D-alanine carboxypeptidase-like protein [Curtobacterium sp. AG1037]